MAAFLKIDICRTCQRNLPWEFVPAVLVNGKQLAGTGVWRSQLLDGYCPPCITEIHEKRNSQRQDALFRARLIELFGGEKPYREFTFGQYGISARNAAAFERCKAFDPASENLYLWGSCGVGKTHLAFASVRRCVEQSLAAEIITPWQLVRQVRMKEPAQEQEQISRLADAEVLLIDDIGKGSERPFAAHLLQEIVDRRDFNDRAGLLVTSQLSLDDLAARLGDDSLPSRLAGLCATVEVSGPDRRLWRVSGRASSGRILDEPHSTLPGSKS